MLEMSEAFEVKMKFQKSKDGVARVSVQVIFRFDREEIEEIRKYLRDCGQDHSDKAVREHVKIRALFVELGHGE